MAEMYLVSVISVICSFSHFGNAHKDEVYPQQNITTKYGDGVSSDGTTTFRNGYSLFLERATTYKSDFDVSPKITTKYTNGYGLSSDLTTHSFPYGDNLTMIPLVRASTNASIVRGNNNDERKDYWNKIRPMCPTGLGYFQVRLPMTYLKTVYLELAIVAQITLVNGFILYIFFKQENRTPVTILLSALAISDTTAAILMTIPMLISYQIYDNQIDFSDGMPQLYMCDFPQCLLYSFLNELKYTFHFVSLLLTTLLCLQKTAALLWPMWSKCHLTNTVSVICSIFTFLICTFIFSPILYHSLSIVNVNDTCCFTPVVLTLYIYFYIMVNGCSIVACLVIVFCTVYMICKLTILRRNLPWTDSPAVQKRNRISAITVVLICVIFILSESMFFVTVSLFTLYEFKIIKPWSLYFIIKPYTDLSIIIGFSLNFIVYIVMGRQIRHKLWITLTNIVKCCKCW